MVDTIQLQPVDDAVEEIHVDIRENPVNDMRVKFNVDLSGFNRGIRKAQERVGQLTTELARLGVEPKRTLAMTPSFAKTLRDSIRRQDARRAAGEPVGCALLADFSPMKKPTSSVVHGYRHGDEQGKRDAEVRNEVNRLTQELVEMGVMKSPMDRYKEGRIRAHLRARGVNDPGKPIIEYEDISDFAD